MDNQKFKKYLSCAKSTDGDYSIGYQKGLRRHFHGEKFGNESDHNAWMALDDHRGRGYRDGIAGNPPEFLHGNVGNKNASKEAKNDTHLHLRVNSEDKAAWVKAADGKLAPWVIDTLNRAAKN